MRSIVAAVCMVVACANVLAQPATPAASPLLGRWSLDVSRLPMPPQERPKSVIITFGDAGHDQWTTHVDIVYAHGEQSHASGTNRLDGTPATVSGSDEADIGALKNPQPNVLVMTLAKRGGPASTRVYAVSPDSQSLVETSAYYGDDGRPILKTYYFTRLP